MASRRLNKLRDECLDEHVRSWIGHVYPAQITPTSRAGEPGFSASGLGCAVSHLGRRRGYPTATLLELPTKFRKAALAVWRADRSLAKTYDQIRRAEAAGSRLEAIRAARAATRQRMK